MTTKRKTKQALVGAEVLFTSDDVEAITRIDPNLVRNFVDIISLDGLDGSPVTPSSGDYNIFVKTDAEGGFKSLSDNGTLSALLTGGNTLADGVEEGASFAANPLEIKVVPATIAGAVAYRVTITQNLN